MFFSFSPLHGRENQLLIFAHLCPGILAVHLIDVTLDDKVTLISFLQARLVFFKPAGLPPGPAQQTPPKYQF